MKIAVFCSSSSNIEEKYKETAFELGRWIAQNGHTLIYGGASGGSMDAVASGALQENGAIIGVIAEAILRMKRGSSLPMQLIKQATLNERKLWMKEQADAFVVLPGSFGTLDEMLDVIASGIVGEHKKPLIILNQDGFYDLFLQQIARMQKEKFTPEIKNYQPYVVSNTEGCFELIKIHKTR